MAAKDFERSAKQLATSRALADKYKKYRGEICPCDECKEGRAAARARLAAKGIEPRRWTPQEFQRRMDLIREARKRERLSSIDLDAARDDGATRSARTQIRGSRHLAE